MHTGKIKKLIGDRGFGFISATDGREIFFHQSNLIDVKITDLTKDEAVEFEVERGDKGPCAVNIRVSSKDTK